MKFGTLLLLISFLLINPGLIFSQGHKITGIVTSKNFDNFTGVIILLKGTDRSCISDITGKFEIHVNTLNDTLLFSYPGYSDLEFPVEGRLFIEAELIEEDNILDEVVITALGIKREKKSLGYSVDEIQADDIHRAKEISIINFLSGRAAGLSVSSTNGGSASSSRIILRSNNSFNENQALIVVNGVPINNSTISNSTDEWGGKDYGNGISDINPDDIETISILKGAGAAALYGSRAVNGVILITTKSGNSKGIKIKLSSSFSVETANIYKNFQNKYGAGSDGKFETHWDINENDVPEYNSDQASYYGSWGPEMNGQQIIDWDGKPNQFSAQADNYKDYFQPGNTWINSVSIESGKIDRSVRFTVSDLRNKDIIPSSSYQRTNLGLNMNFNLLNKVSFKTYISFINQRSDNRPGLSDSHNNVARNYIMMPRNISTQSLSENISDQSGLEQTWYSSWNWMTNPYWNDLFELSFDEKNRIFGNLSVKYDITENLNIILRTSLDFSKIHFEEIGASFGMIHPSGFFSKRTIISKQYNNDFLLNYFKKLHSFIDLSVSLGGNAYYEKFDHLSENTVNGLIEPYIYSIENSAGIPETNELVFEKAVNSLYYMFQVGFKDLLYFDITGRNDWSSTLAEENNSYFYHSYNLGFVFSELLKNKELLSFGKLRFSISKVGNDTDPYQTSLTYFVDSTDIYGTYSHINKLIPPTDLKPEQMISFETGTDLSFIDRLLGIDLSFYRTNTFNQIVAVNISSTSGAQNALINAGNIQNQGIELQLNLNPVNKKNFDWSFTINYTKNYSLVKELTEGIDNYLLLEHWGLSIEARPGHPYGDIVGYGIQKDDEGNKLVNENGLYIRTENPTVLGNINPDFSISFNNSLVYKKISLNFLIDAKIGGEMFSGTNMYGNGYSGNLIESLEGREDWYASETQRESLGISSEDWTATGGYLPEGVFTEGTMINNEDVSGQVNNIYIDPFDYWHQFADWTNEIHEPFVYDAGFIKLRELSLSYQVNTKALTKFKIQNIKIGVYGRNLWLIYKNVPNVDPESFHTNGNGQGYELYSYPTRKSMGINLTIEF